MKKIKALVPMKGNSERVPNKNLKDFCGRPLYHHIIETLENSKNVGEIFVNTDSSIIKKDIKLNFKNIIVLNRPKNIQGDFVSMNKIINHDISKIKGNYFIQTHSTNPLIKSRTIDLAIEDYFKNIGEYDSLFSVNKLQTRLYDKSFIPLNHNINELIRTQDLPPIFEENSNFYVFSKDSFHKSGQNRIGIKPNLFEIDKYEGIDIDDIQEFHIAEAMYKLQNEFKRKTSK